MWHKNYEKIQFIIRNFKINTLHGCAQNPKYNISSNMCDETLQRNTFETRLKTNDEKNLHIYHIITFNIY